MLCLLPGELFAQAPVDHYPGIIVEAVTDSSRYFVIRIEDGNGNRQYLCCCVFSADVLTAHACPSRVMCLMISGRHAFIGIGFADRGDSFDFNVALQDHFK